jgi:RNA recognition motif-containing protein
MLLMLKAAKKESLKNKFEGCNLVVKNIPKELNETNLFEIFRKFGEIKSARLLYNEGAFKEIKNESGEVIDKEFVYESKGCGFVLFKKVDDAKNVTLNIFYIYIIIFLG